MGCEDNCRLSADSVTVLGPSTNYDHVVMTESGPNTAIFESFDLNGESELEIVAEAAGDSKVVFNYADDYRDMIITYHDATIDLEDPNGGDWIATEVATFTINDPDANKNPLDTDELEIGDETDKVPTISMGTGGLSLTEGSNPWLNSGNGTIAITGAAGTAGSPGIEVGADAGSSGNGNGVNVYNTTDNSDRLRIIHNGTAQGGGYGTTTWINVTTGHTKSAIQNLPGTVVLSFNVEGPAGLVSSTDVDVYI